MYRVRKRDGKYVAFSLAKIHTAITMAFEAQKRQYSEDVIELLALRVTADFEPKIKDNAISVEEIQDSVETVLSRAGYEDIAKSYILYRKQHETIRNMHATMLDYKTVVDSYVKEADWRVKENSTVTYSVGGLILSNSGAITANYWLTEAYDAEIARAHRDADLHLHDLSMLTGYCAGWSLRQLILDGLGGIPGKITSSPARHLATLCNQMVNFLGIMQNEWAGAQAFSSFDTYLAPFVREDKLSYNAVKKCIESFIYGVNTPSRWGCVDAETEVLSTTGFKKYDELKEGDSIYTWKDGQLQVNRVNKVIVKPFNGKLHSYRVGKYNQTVTPNHRVLVQKHNSNECKIKLSEEIFNVKTPYSLPVQLADSAIPDIPLSVEEIALAAMVYTDGHIEMRKESVHKVTIYKSPKRVGNEELCRICDQLHLKFVLSHGKGNFGEVNKYTFYGEHARRIIELTGNTKTCIDEKFLRMSAKQATVFLQTWVTFDGDEDKLKLQCDNQTIADQIQQIAILAGYTSYFVRRNKTFYVKLRKTANVIPTKREEVPYDGVVWCPNVENGTAIFRKNGSVYISGQTQAPFSNITLDWTVPKDLAYQPAIVGGKLMDFAYRDCQPEMDMVNRAFIEIMLEGDAHGRGFQYPIPTYSITKNFDWSETENNKLLFEMTAKYGTPYFSNYVNSDMQPDDVRSMCPLHGSEQVLVLANDENFCNLTSIDEMYGWQKMGWFGADPVYTLLHRGKKIKAKLKVFPNQAFLKVTLENGVSIRLSTNHQNLTLEHGVVPTDQLTTEDYLPFNIDKYTSTHPEDCHDVTSTLGQLVGWYLQYGVFAKGGRVKFYVPNEQIAQAIYATGQIEHAARNHYYVYDDLKRGEKKRYKALQPKFTASACLVEMECDNLNIALSNHVYTLDTKRMLTGNYLESSEEFRQGILSTWPVETGGRWTVASEHVDTIRTLLTSLGRALIAKAQDDGTSKLTVFSADTTSKKCRFDDQKQYIWFKIKSIENEDEYGNGYCFEVQEPNEPYFMLPSGLITHNCRLRLDLRELRKKSGGYFGSGESTGSVGVVTINMPRIAYLAKDEADFYSRLGKLMDIAARSLKIKRKVITKLLEGGLYPYTKHYLGTFANHFSTIGLVGMNEVGLNAKWLGKDMTDPKTQAFARDVLNFMRNRLSDYQEQYGDLYNLEATPAESTSYRLAKHDVERYPDIKTAAGSGTKENRTPYYTNSSHLPVGYTDDIFTALDAQDELQTLYTSGTVFHAFLGEKLSGWKAAATLVRRIAEQYKLPYYTLSPTYSICHQHGYLAGEVYTCPHCGETTEIYSRVTGYYRPVGNWNAGKTQEFKDRQVYQLDSSIETGETVSEELHTVMS